mmetsp:Transcript_9790/g.17117  ORF Transcript_9790/g.17117 Transcript_9790/m.17117 type:complete len:260 (+) Transcript_9790:139-918(+)|eukprot:CAMPEP_0183704814 /NCGR_PEP_ID=MMETSP0737-20130205/2080_1 /TAXON_ID=385413 /ORGANISM="Thalassiosira miniscula, Strain CCMP1093" /LENGTH=259 /DNA_ID=CAMNT_0025931823 /DNA_START=84 /DNA_END=863 /DNA_ORIENTATION=+
MKSSLYTLFLCLIPTCCTAFTTPASQYMRPNNSLHELSAKKKKARSGQGFGKQTAPSTPAIADIEDDDDNEPTSASSSAMPLQSIENAPQQTQTPSEQLNLDPNLSEEERSQAILRSKFGLKSYEEQQADIGDYRALLDAEKKKEQRDKLRNIESLWPEDKDFLSVLPPGLIKGIDSFLKLGLGACTVLFLVAGVFITIEAGSKATGSELPDGLEEFVVNVVQPNFTPGLGVLLGFSVALGVFSVALGGSAQSSYREDP